MAALPKADRPKTDKQPIPLQRKTSTPADPLYNPEIERAVLGALYRAFPEDRANVVGELAADLFDEPKHAAVFDALIACIDEGKEPDPALVDANLQRAGTLHLWRDWEMQINAACSSGYKLAHYAGEVARNWYARENRRIGSALMQGEMTNDEAVRALTTAKERRDRILAPKGDTFTLSDLMAEQLPPLRFVVPDILPEGLGILGAKQKIGKSWFAFGTAIGVARGGVVLGRRVEQGDVLYLALEDGKRRLQERARKIVGDEGIPHGLEIATQWPRLDAGGLHKIEAWCKQHTARRLIIIDVFAKVRPPRARGADPYSEDYAAMSGLHDLAERYGVCILVIHHTRKAEAADVFDEMNGTMGIAGSADTVMVLQRTRGEADAVLHVTGREIQREGAHALRFDPAICVWQYLGDADEYAHGPLQGKVVAFIKQSTNLPVSRKAIAEGLDMTDKDGYNKLGVTLKRLTDKGILRNTTAGYVVNSVNAVNSVNSVNGVNEP